jgi:hypothetical protein
MGLTDYTFGDKRFFQSGVRHEQENIIKLLKENSRCRIDGGHDTEGYCFCEAIRLIQGRL